MTRVGGSGHRRMVEDEIGGRRGTTLPASATSASMEQAPLSSTSLFQDAHNSFPAFCPYYRTLKLRLIFNSSDRCLAARLVLSAFLNLDICDIDEFGPPLNWLACEEETS